MHDVETLTRRLAALDTMYCGTLPGFLKAHGERVVKMRFHRGRTVEGLAEADQPCIGMHPHPQDVGEFLGPQRLDRRDLQSRLPGEGRLSDFRRATPILVARARAALG